MYRYWTTRITFLACSLGLTTACGTRSFNAFQDAAQEVEGIYAITVDMENAYACTNDGASVLGQRANFAMVKSANYGFSPALFYMRCASLDACRVQFDHFGVIEALNADATVFSDVDALGNFRGGRLTTGYWQDDGTCRDAEKDNAILLVDDDGTLSFVVEHYLIAETQQDADGHCTTDGTADAFDSAICQSTRAMQGVLIEVR